MRIALPYQRARCGDVERMINALVEFARGEALEIGALPPGDVDDLDIFAGAHDISLCRRVVDANILERSARGSGRCVSFCGGMRERMMCRRIGVVVSCAPAFIGAPGAATISKPSRDTVNSVVAPGVLAKQRDGARLGKIDAAPLEPSAH